MKNSFKTNTIFLSLWAAVSTLIPMVVLCVFSATNQTGNFTLNNFLKIGTYGHVILKSMLFAATTTIGCLLVSFPVAYIVFKNMKPSNQKILITLIMLPTLTNMILRTFAWMTLLEKNGLINKALKLLQLPPLKLINTPAAVILVMIYDFLPFMILPIYGSICQINRNIVDAGRDLGANELQTLCKIMVPLSFKGVLQGTSLVFVMSCSTFIVPRIMSGGTTILIGDLIESNFMGEVYNPCFGSTLALSLNVAIMFIIVLGRLKKTKKGTLKNETKIFI